MKNLPILLFSALLVAPLSALHGAEAPSKKPNIVVILCDDLGYGDLSCQGHPLIRTPHIAQ